MNTHSTLTSLFTDIADAIREKDGSTAPIVADAFPAAVRAIPSGGGEDWATPIIERTISGSYTNLSASKIGEYAFTGCSSLAAVSFPACTSLDAYAFYKCISLATVSFPACTNLGSHAFRECSLLATVSFPACTVIQASAFRSCYNLLSLYLLNSSVATLSISNAFSATPIDGYTTSTGGVYGSIFVRASLLSQWQAKTNWTYFSSRFVGLTDEQIAALEG